MSVEVFLIPLVLSILPIDADIKMHIGILLSEIFSRGYLLRLTSWIFKLFHKKQIVILNRTNEMDNNPLFHKVQDYLVSKFALTIESCELIPKNGDVEFSLSDVSDKVFTDSSEIHGKNYEFELKIEKVVDGPFNDGSKGTKQIVIKSKTATSDIIKLYIKKIMATQLKNTNIIKIYRPLIHGKKKEDRTIEWDSVLAKTNKTLKNTIYSDEVENILFNDIDRFMYNEQWYADRGIPYKRGYFLYSVPGQGKTSVAKIVANKYGIPIFCLDLTTIDENAVLTKLMTEINYYSGQEKYILLIEDIDRSDFIRSWRRANNNLSMDCFLNAIDGVSEPHGRIVIMSANDSTDILCNTALMRPGRIDKSIEFKSCDRIQIKKMYELFYDKHPYMVDWDNWTFNEDLSAAYIIKLLQDNVDHPEVFMRLVGESKKEDEQNVPLDETFKKAILIAKNEQNDQKHIEVRRGKKRRFSNTIEDKVRRTKYNIARTNKRINSLSKNLSKSTNKLPLFLEKLKKKQENKRLKSLKEKAKNRKAYISDLIKCPEEYVEEEYETPAFMTNSIATEDIIPNSITTYEVMEDDYELFNTQIIE